MTSIPSFNYFIQMIIFGNSALAVLVSDKQFGGLPSARVADPYDDQGKDTRSHCTRAKNSQCSFLDKDQRCLTFAARPIASAQSPTSLAVRSPREAPLRRQLIEQRLRLFQIERVEAFGEPAVDRSEQFASLLRLALV
jgi:hypothetical protein